MSKYLAVYLTIVQLVSGQDYSSPSSATETTTTDTITSTSSVLLPAMTTLTSVLDITTDNSITDISTPLATTYTGYYCTGTVSAVGPFVTVFNTVYPDVCDNSGALTQITYIITDTCGCTDKTDYTRPTGCPPGFTTVEKTCSMSTGSSVITVTTPIAPAIANSSPTTIQAGSGQDSNPQNPQNPQSSHSPQNPQNGQYTQSGPTPTSALGTQPTYETTNNAKPAAGSSSLALIIVMSMAVVTGLMCIL